ncbi:LLM class flavin-dependent oxidoreductase [Actinomadura madurae]
MRLGVAIDLGSAAATRPQVDRAARLLETAEANGLSSAWLGESYHVRPEPFHLPAALIVLAHLAGRTDLPLGTAVLLARAYEPRRLAYEAALLDQLCTGRFTLGLALGNADLAERLGGGTDGRSPGEWFAALVAALRETWSASTGTGGDGRRAGRAAARAAGRPADVPRRAHPRGGGPGRDPRRRLLRGHQLRRRTPGGARRRVLGRPRRSRRRGGGHPPVPGGRGRGAGAGDGGPVLRVRPELLHRPARVDGARRAGDARVPAGRVPGRRRGGAPAVRVDGRHVRPAEGRAARDAARGGRADAAAGRNRRAARTGRRNETGDGEESARMSPQDGIPTYKELLERQDAPPGSSWGIFGENDQLGTLNFLGPGQVRDAVGLVRRGEVFNLDYPLNTFVPAPAGTRPATVHHIFANNPNHRDDWLDSFYLQSTSQIDGLRHIRHPRHGFYGGVPDEEIGEETPALGIQTVAERGIVARGVLLDVARHFAERGTPLDLAGNYMITPEDLDEVAAAQGVEFRPGDVLLLRVGWASYWLDEVGEEDRQAFKKRIRHPGLIQSKEMIAWLWDHRFAMVASDDLGVEAHPVNPDSGLVDPDEPRPERGVVHNGMMHRPLIALLGLFLGELWNLEALAEDCRADRTYEFMLTAKPLNLVGGVGSPPNAMAIK